MKNFFKLSLLASFLVIGLSSLSAQKGLSEGTIKYEVTEVVSDAMEAQMLKGTMINVAFNQSNSRLSMSMMGGMIEMDVISDIKGEKSVVLTNMMGTKAMMKQDEEGDAKADKASPNFDIEYVNSETKEIAGQTCHKAIFTDKKSGEKMNLFIAKGLTPKVKFVDEMFPGLEGLPMEVTLEAEGMGKVTIACVSLVKSVEKSVFDIPEGYPEMTPEEFEKQMGGMMNLGF